MELINLFKVLPLLGPFIKEAWGESSRPSGGERPNRWKAYAAGLFSLVVSLCFVIAWSKSDHFEEMNKLQLMNDRLRQQTDVSSAEFTRIRNENNKLANELDLTYDIINELKRDKERLERNLADSRMETLEAEQTTEIVTQENVRLEADLRKRRTCIASSDVPTKKKRGMAAETYSELLKGK